MTGPSDKSADPVSPTAKPTMLGIAETLESIVVAFILAFVFRAFVVEAFVIPTGSMAVTLYGAQLTQTCSTCGYEYAYGVSTPPTDPAGRPIALPAVHLRCPNCDMERDGFDTAALAQPDSGDRILVFKWPFDVGGELLGPHRWDVTVFKDPRDGITNFIKRLVGLPGEVLEIIDGDVYTVSVETLEAKEPGLVEDLDELRMTVAAHRQSGGGPEPPQIHGAYLELNRRLLPHLRIQPKTDRAQQSLWCNVHNHDFLPNYDGSLREDQLRTRVVWRPEGEAANAAWKTADRRITFASDGQEPLFIRFDGKPIDDSCAYNNDGMGRHVSGHFPVGDLRLSLGWLPRAGRGGLTLEMNRNRDRFIAELAVDGTAELKWTRLDDGGQWSRPELVGRKNALGPFLNGRTTQVTLAIVDYRVALSVDGREVLATTDDPERGYRPRVPDLDRFVEATVNQQRPDRLITPSQVRIGARDLQCDLLHVRLERDVYYRSQRLTAESARPSNPYDGWPGWATAGRPILLRKGHLNGGQWYHGEYFMLGDNSPASKDSRLWWEIGDHLKPLGEEYQLGTVPEDQIIGRAFFVYWPAGYRASWAGGIGLIPDFGRMRWIR